MMVVNIDVIKWGWGYLFGGFCVGDYVCSTIYYSLEHVLSGL